MHERLEAFREEAEVLTPVPAFEDIELRGRVRRNRHRAAAGAVAASVLAVTGIWATAGGQPSGTLPADAPASPPIEVMFMGVEEPPAMTYDRPAGWTWQGWGTVNRVGRAGDVARFAAVIVERVAKDPCQISRGAPDYRSTPSDPQQLAAQLASMARVRVVQEPVPDDRLGVPATYLRLVGTGPACSGEADPKRRFMAYQDNADGGGWPDPLGTADLWIVDVGDHLVVVEAVTGSQASAEDRSTLSQVIDSVEISPAGAE